jgi:hypothetical protein
MTKRQGMKNAASVHSDLNMQEMPREQGFLEIAML